MTLTPHLFTRRDICRKIDIPADVVNYWMREGVIRARSGGTGRGDPRRVDYPEMMLIALLNELRGFGLSVAALKGLAERFHTARDRMDALGVNRSNQSSLVTLVYLKQILEKEGFVEVGTWKPKAHPEHGFQELDHVPGRWVGKVSDLQYLKAHPDLWGEEGASEEELSLAALAIELIEPDEFNTDWFYWITLIDISEPDKFTDAIDFVRNETGDWGLSRGDPRGTSWISVNDHRLNLQLWGGDQSLRY